MDTFIIIPCLYEYSVNVAYETMTLSFCQTTANVISESWTFFATGSVISEKSPHQTPIRQACLIRQYLTVSVWAEITLRRVYVT